MGDIIDALFIVYLVGCLVAFIMGLIEAYFEHKHGSNIEELSAGMVIVTALSWIFVIRYGKQVYEYVRENISDNL